MPRIKQIISQVERASPGRGPLYSTQAEAAQTEATARLGQAVVGLAQTGLDIIERQDMWEADLQFAEANTEMAKRFQEAMDTAEPDGKGFFEQTQAQFRDYIEERMDAAPNSSRARQELQLRLKGLQVDYSKKALSFQAQRRAENQTFRMGEAIDKARNAVRANPLELDNQLGVLDGVINGSPSPTGLKNKLWTGAKVGLADSALDGLVAQYERGPVSTDEVDKLITDLKKGERGYKDRVSPGMYDSALTRLETRRKQLDIADSARLESSKQDVIAQIRNKGDADPVLIQKVEEYYGKRPEGLKGFREEVRSERQLYKDRAAVATMSPEELQNLVAARQTGIAATGIGAAAREQDFRQLMRVVAERNKALAEDPVGYVLPNNAQLAPKYEEAYTQGDAMGFQQAMGEVAETQRHLGVPPHRVRYLSKDMATNLVAQITSADSAENSANMIEHVKTMAGNQWPQIYRELRQNGLTGAMATAGRLNQVQDAAVRLRLISSAQAGVKELTKGLESTDIETANAKINDLYADLRESFSLAGAAGVQYTSDEIDAARLLTYSYMREGLSAGDASKKAHSELIGRYDFQDGYRVPKGMGANAAAHTQEVLRYLSPTELMPIAPGSLVERVGQQGAEEFAFRRQKAAWDLVQNEGRWVTYGAPGPDGKVQEGLMLMVPDDRSRSHYSPALRKDGAPIRLTFEEMQVMPRPSMVDLGVQGP